MLQSFWRYIDTYHSLFHGGRCQGWELEELIVKSIKDDTQVRHNVVWREGGHDDKADIEVEIEKDIYFIQIKSGRYTNNGSFLNISGHRLSRYNDDIGKMTHYLNGLKSDIISVPYMQMNDDSGRHHKYDFCYISKNDLRNLENDRWDVILKSDNSDIARWEQVNEKGVIFQIHKKMSNQIWWKIPKNIIQYGGSHISN